MLLFEQAGSFFACDSGTGRVFMGKVCISSQVGVEVE
jgi:hypothetical protein